MKILILLITAVVASAQVAPKASRTAEEMEPLLGSIATFEYGQSREAQAQFTQFVQDSLASPALVKQIETKLLAFLQSNASAEGKQFALRELSLIGTDAAIPVLAPMLTQPATSEMARFALARIPGAAVDQALRDLLAKTSGSIRIGIIGSLGQRRDTKAVAALATFAASTDISTAEAAIAALAEIADRPALAALAAIHAKTSGAVSARAAEAYLACAARIAGQGDKETALKVYRELTASKEPPMVRVGALTGITSLSPKEALPLLAAELESKDARVQFAAIRLLGGIPGSEASSAMQRAFANVSPAGKVRVLSVLTERGDRSVQPLLARAVKDESPEVRAAALYASGAMGDAASIPMLAEAAATGKPVEQAAARQGLRNMKGAGIDPALVAAIGSSQGKVKAELILAAGERGSAAAADAVVAAIAEADPDVRREALRAGRNVAGRAQVHALLSMVAEKRDVGPLLALALQRSGPGEISSAIAAYKNATAVEQRLALLQALGQTSGSEALALTRAALTDSSPEIVRGAVLSLSDWKNAAPLPDLLATAKLNPSPAMRVLAVRGYLKVVGLPSERPHTESARLLGDVVSLATEQAEKRTLLSLLGNYPCKESLQIAEALLKDESVASEAKAAVDRINRALASRGTQR